MSTSRPKGLPCATPHLARGGVVRDAENAHAVRGANVGDHRLAILGRRRAAAAPHGRRRCLSLQPWLRIEISRLAFYLHWAIAAHANPSAILEIPARYCLGCLLPAPVRWSLAQCSSAGGPPVGGATRPTRALLNARIGFTSLVVRKGSNASLKFGKC